MGMTKVNKTLSQKYKVAPKVMDEINKYIAV